MALQTGPIILIVGTRPEGIKMIPVYFALKNAGFNTLLCSTMQHDELLTEVFDLFNVKPDFDLAIMRLGQDLFYLTQSILQKTKELFIKEKPSLVLVQGDTTSSMAASLAAFYLSIPLGHIEAGLRTDDIFAPFPEEMNRRFVGVIAQYHFTPTPMATANLLAQGIKRETIFYTGNTVVDALQTIQRSIEQARVVITPGLRSIVELVEKKGSKLIVLTAHRRESFDGGIERILTALKNFLLEHPDVQCIYPYHPNPHVIKALTSTDLTKLPNCKLIEPVSYKDMVYLLMNAHVVITDSGGIQEEAVSLGKPVLVLREKTERMEGVWAGIATIVGTDSQKIYDGLYNAVYKSSLNEKVNNLYGDGCAAQKIVSCIQTLDFIKQTKKNNIFVASCLALKEKETTMQKVCIIGLGYIGLPTAIIAAEYGFAVHGFDIDQNKIEKINSGDPVIHEPEIFEKLHVSLGTGRLKASAQIGQADYFIIAVPTPFKEDKKADLSCVYDAAQEIAKVLAKGNVVIIESTIPVGTTTLIAQYLEQLTGLKAGYDFYCAHCPERVLPGKIFKELVENDRIIGGINQESVLQAKEFYKQFVQGALYLTDATSAEMVKLIENSSRDVQIAFANQVASMARAVGLNPYEIIELANKHPRVNILNPGCGVGGHCIAVDPWFLVESFPDNTQLLKAARFVNDNKPKEVLADIKKAVEQWQESNTGTCTVAVLGLAYKPDIDDMRESPALEIAHVLQTMNDIKLLVCEPYITKNKISEFFGDAVVTYAQALEQADIIVFLVRHTRFKAVDYTLFKGKKVLDFCGMFYEPKQQSDEKEFLFWPAQNVNALCKENV